MESDIFVKANEWEMKVSFNNEQLFSLRFYEKIDLGLYHVVIRHHQRKIRFKGTYTLRRIRQVLAKEKYAEKMLYVPYLPDGFETAVFDTDKWMEDIEKNEKQIEEIEKCAKQEKSLCYRFLHRPVADGVGIYQIIEVHKNFCKIRYCSIDGKFDYMVDCWGREVTLSMEDIQTEIWRQDCFDL